MSYQTVRRRSPRSSNCLQGVSGPHGEFMMTGLELLRRNTSEGKLVEVAFLNPIENVLVGPPLILVSRPTIELLSVPPLK